MCYSAQLEQDWLKYLRVIGPENGLSFADFIKKYWWRQREFPSMKIPKAIDAWFSNPHNGDEQKIAALIDDYNEGQTTKFQQELFKQKKRLADAERSLEKKETKKALKDQQVSTDKIAWSLSKLNDLKRTELKDRDSYIFPGYFAPLIVMENGRRTVKLMRYQCRPHGKPKHLDRDLSTFNARRDNLGGSYWKPLFGYSHGIMIVNSFFEKVSKAKYEGRELTTGEEDSSLTLEFHPKPTQQMYVACLWSHWQEGNEELDSFAAITDEPSAEILAAGHDRCIIPIKEENIDAWLNPDAKRLDALHAILDDRARPYYEHELVAAA